MKLCSSCGALTLLAALSLAAPQLLAAAPAKAPAARPTPVIVRTASTVRLAALPTGTRYLPGQPLLFGLVQPVAIGNFLQMIGANDEAAGQLTGVIQLLKDQLDGPLSVAAYADATGKSGSVLLTAKLKQALLTRQLMGVALGGDSDKGPKKSTYRGQDLITMDLPKSETGASPIPLQPTLTITDTDHLVAGTTLDAVKLALDTYATGKGGFDKLDNLAAMLKEFPLSPTTDVWLFVPQPVAGAAGVKSALSLPTGALPIGPVVATLKFTPTGLRFEGLATVDRAKTAKLFP